MYGKYVHSYVFDYMQQFWNNYAGIPRFGLAMFNEGHEGTGDVIGIVDDDLHEFLSEGYSSGSFDNTAVFLLADHGLHMGVFYMLEVTMVTNNCDINSCSFTLREWKIIFHCSMLCCRNSSWNKILKWKGHCYIIKI
jgi:hypothetical protein